MLSQPQRDVVDKLGMAIGAGMVAGIAINTAHELGHKKEKHERWFSRVALAQTAYGHFFIEHNRGHHVRVATPEDPASSRLGRERCGLPAAHRGRQPAQRLAPGEAAARSAAASRWTWRNDVLNAWAMTVVLWGAVIVAVRRRAAALPGVQALVGIWLLESVNYLEHYGMMRQKHRVRPLRAGQPEPQLEQQQHRHERAALPPAAPQRPPRQPDPPLPGAA